MGDRVLVTGGAGFIGSHLVERLLRLGFRVTVMDNMSTGLHSNLANVRNDIELDESDVRDLDACRRLCKGRRFVFHQAALGSVPRSVEDPETTFACNEQGTLNMLLAARDAGAERFVFAASSSAYGDTPVLPKVETMPPHPRSPYAASKLAGEHYISAFAASYGLPAISLRYFNIFGPRQRPDGPYAAVIPRFFDHLRRNAPVTIFGDGEQTRDFTFVANAVDANIQALDAQSQWFGGVFNVAGGERISINQLYRHIAELVGSDVQPVYGPARQGDVRDSLADIGAAHAAFGYVPRVDWRTGLRFTAEAM